MNRTFYLRVGKRWLDVAVSLIGLLLFGPLLFLFALAVRLTSPGPAIFRQTRTGRFNKPFYILKFRTMKATTSDAGSLLTAAGDSRITPLGRWLRETKIDELPQLLNVLTGDMSLVGPRPEVPLYTASYSEPQKKVFAERPGITGPSIIFDEEELMAGRPDKEGFYVTEILPKKLEIDLAYCADICLTKDLRLLFLTFARLSQRTALRSTAARSIEHLDRMAGTNPQHRP
jgi:lipopolysaccharide/colanic/teichoic acid biosynthesis glycosyltransferase